VTLNSVELQKPKWVQNISV